MIECKTAIEY